MKRLPVNRVGALLALAALLLLASAALAQGLGSQRQGLAADRTGYDLSWWTADGGGTTAGASGDYALGGTAGQPDAGPSLSGGAYTLAGGFWGGGARGEYRVCLPLALRNYP